uniref:uncharacterized protein LOC120334267 isoform X1 n=1 Tax=Styela clava TaxID=7725 RepID=UPI00193ACFA1|nr:uncharacterized protein LOC120334267 isoform X1 [Styela clava]
MASITNLTYKLLSVKHLCAVRNLIEEHFTSTFSLGVYLNWTKEDSIPAYYPRIESFLKQGNSLGAFSDKDAKLRGVAINVEHDDNERIKYDETLHISEKTDTINRLMVAIGVNQLSDILETKNFWEMRMGTVHPSYRRKGLMPELMKRSTVLAKQRGIEKLVACQTYNKAPEEPSKMDRFEIIRHIELKNYLDPVTGQKVFSGMKPPNDVQVLIAKTLT